jgi:hypothetical protein
MFRKGTDPIKGCTISCNRIKRPIVMDWESSSKFSREVSSLFFFDMHHLLAFWLFTGVSGFGTEG